jgi:iron complex transport system substrate-binding protein
MSLRTLLAARTPPPAAYSALMVAAPTFVGFVVVILLLSVPWVVGAGELPDHGRPQRIVTIAPNSAEIICSLGACDSIVGVSKFCVYPPELKSRPRVGGLFDPDLEKIIALRPDLIVLRGKSESVQQLAAERGIAIHRDRTERLPDVERCILELGQRLGREKEADRLVETFRGRIDAVRKRVAGKPRPRVLLTILRQPDKLANLMTTGKGTFLDEMLAIAGGANVFGHLDMAYPQVSSEGIVARRPEVIIELMPEIKLTDALKRQMLEQWKTLGSIPAVADSRIFFATDDNALIPSPRYVEIIEKVSRILHPEPDVEP